MKYLQGKISRPNVYTQMPPSNFPFNAPIVGTDRWFFARGPELCYLFPAPGNQILSVIAEWEAYKARGGKTAVSS